MKKKHEITIPVYKPRIGEIEKANVVECLETEWISSKGRFVNDFENAFAEYLGLPYAAATCNGTTALHIALLALGIGAGDEVIVPTLTYIAAPNAVTYTGASPVFVDSTKSTWQMSCDDIQRAINQKTKAILPVHLYGQSCDMNSIAKIAEEFDLLVIEDCAEAIGTKFQGQHVGSFGDIATFSFYGNKTITTGEGGMVVTKNPSTAERVNRLKGQGLAHFREYWHDIIGYNYRMTNICAAIGLGQLTRLDQTLARKEELAILYRKLLEGIVKFQTTSENSRHSHWMVCFTVANPTLRDPLREHLSDNGIETRPVFYPAHSMPMYAKFFRRMPNAEFIASCGINLPSHPDLTDEQVEFICDKIRDFLT